MFPLKRGDHIRECTLKIFLSKIKNKTFKYTKNKFILEFIEFTFE